MDRIEELMRSMPANVPWDDGNLWLHLQPTRNPEKWNAFYGRVGEDEDDNGIPSGYYVEADSPIEALEELKSRFDLLSTVFK